MALFLVTSNPSWRQAIILDKKCKNESNSETYLMVFSPTESTVDWIGCGSKCSQLWWIGLDWIGSVYVKTLLSKLSILFIQEHWLSDSQLTLLGTLSQDFFIYRCVWFWKQRCSIYRAYQH